MTTLEEFIKMWKESLGTLKYIHLNNDDVIFADYYMIDEFDFSTVSLFKDSSFIATVKISNIKGIN